MSAEVGCRSAQKVVFNLETGEYETEDCIEFYDSSEDEQEQEVKPECHTIEYGEVKKIYHKFEPFQAVKNFRQYNQDGTEQNKTIRELADKVSTKMGKKTTRQICATFWCDDDEVRKDEFARVCAIWEIELRFVLYGAIERTEENKKPHCHCVICFKTSKQFKTILKTLDPHLYHIEQIRSFAAAYSYCLKENPNDVLKFGTPLKQGARTDLKNMFESTNYDIKEIQEKYPDKYCRYRNGIKDICESKKKEDYILNWVGLEKTEDQYIEKKYEKPIVHWFSGETGAGKTLAAKQMIAERIKEGYDPNKVGIIDGIKNDFMIGDIDDKVEILVIDEFRGDMLKLHDLLKVIDGSIVNIKGSKVRLTPKEIFITSALTPERCYPRCCGDVADSIRQLKRRLTDERVFVWDEDKNMFISKPASDEVENTIYDYSF